MFVFLHLRIVCAYVCVRMRACVYIRARMCMCVRAPYGGSVMNGAYIVAVVPQVYGRCVHTRLAVSRFDWMPLFV